MELSPNVKSVLQTARVIAIMNNKNEVKPEHVYQAFLHNEKSTVRKIFIDKKILTTQDPIVSDIMPPGHEVPSFSEEVSLILTEASRETTTDSISDIKVFEKLTNFIESNGQKNIKLVVDTAGFKKMSEGYEEEEISAISELCIDLTEMAKQGQLDPVIGRDQEIVKICNILSRKKKPNPILIGDPGVGKTAIVELLAQRIVQGNVPDRLKDKRILSLQIAKINAGSGVVGQLEKMMLALISEIQEEGNIILYIDEIHQVSGHANSGYLSNSSANMLKAPLARGTLTCIGSTTLDEYKNSIEKDGGMNRRFQKVYIDETTELETIDIINGITPSFEDFHKVKIEPEVPKLIASLSSVYITGKYQPDNSVDLLDDACVQAASMAKKVDASVVYQTISNMSGIPIKHVNKSMDCSHLKSIEPYLCSRVFGQDEAMHRLASTVIKGQLGVSDRKRPLGVFMFLGPTGVGKTESAKALALALFGTEDALIRLDMSEVAGGFGGTRIVGAPPGFVGYYDNNSFTEKVRDRPYSVVLFDEIEKSSRDVHSILLQIMEEGMATDGRGRKVNFRNTVIIMTGNVGSEHYMQGKLGFSDSTMGIESQVMKSLADHFKPEFINRIDRVCLFKPLSHDIALAVANKLLHELSVRVAEKGVKVNYTPEVAIAIVDKAFDPRFGARGVRRFIDNVIQDLVATEIMDGKFEITVKYEDDIFSA